MISVNISCDKCTPETQLQVRTEKGYFVAECLGCGDIIKIKDVKRGKAE